MTCRNSTVLVFPGLARVFPALNPLIYGLLNHDVLLDSGICGVLWAPLGEYLRDFVTQKEESYSDTDQCSDVPLLGQNLTNQCSGVPLLGQNLKTAQIVQMEEEGQEEDQV